jgi:hypothetical protein
VKLTTNTEVKERVVFNASYTLRLVTRTKKKLVLAKLTSLFSYRIELQTDRQTDTYRNIVALPKFGVTRYLNTVSGNS